MRTAKALILGLQDASAIIDSDLKLIHYNAPYAQLTQLRRAELERAVVSGVSPFWLIGRSADQDASVASKCLKDGQAVRLAEVNVKDSQGRTHTVDLSFIPMIDPATDKPFLVQIIRDVSDEARMQTHYKDLLRLTEARAEDLERIVALRTQELSAALESVTRLSRTDPLTNLLNRRAFVEHGEHSLRLAERHNRIAGILMCDLDFFKKVNDRYGHPAGDALLAATGAALTEAVRKSDVVARIGGEEFVVLLTETDEESILEIARRCMSAIRALDMGKIVGDPSRTQTVSIGAGVFPRHGKTLAEVMSSADQALYVAKRSGRDRVIMYSDTLTHEPASVAARPRVLIADPDLLRRRIVANAITHKYEVDFAGSTQEALSLCKTQRFEAIIADEDLDEDRAVGLLAQALHTTPVAVRILCLGKEDFVLAAKGANRAGVDSIILRKDVDTHLVAAVEDGSIRRRLVGQRLLDGVEVSRNAYTFRTEQLESIIKTRNLEIAFQPIINCDATAVVAFEALSRPPAESKFNPQELFDTALEVGRLWTLSRLVRDKVAENISTLPKESFVFVNLHPGEMDDPLLRDGKEALASYSDRVVFELTERTPIYDYHSFREKADKLRALGYRLAVDDLGAGYASLNSLAMLEPDFVKIDRELVHECHLSTRRMHLIQRIIEFARDQKTKIIAEGVETHEEAETMKRLGCDFLQGYFFGVPSSAHTYANRPSKSPLDASAKAVHAMPSK